MKKKSNSSRSVRSVKAWACVRREGTLYRVFGQYCYIRTTKKEAKELCHPEYGDQALPITITYTPSQRTKKRT